VVELEFQGKFKGVC